MNIEKLKELTDEARNIENIIIKLSEIGSDEYLNIKINISNGYDFKILDTIETENDVTLVVALVEFYNNQLDKIKDEIRKVTKEV